MSEEHRAIIRRVEDEIFNNRNLQAVDTFFSPHYVLRTGPEGTPSGLDAIRDSMAAYLAGFSDLRVSVDQLVAEGDRVVALLTYAGTHDGELFGIPPTGRRIAVRQIAIYRIEGGRIAEEWEVSDQLGLMQQLGVIPAQ